MIDCSVRSAIIPNFLEGEWAWPTSFIRSFFYPNSATVVVQTTQKKRRNTHNCAIVILFALEERVPFAIEHDTYDLWSIFTLRSTSSLSFQSAVKLTHTPSVLALLVREEEWRERSPFFRYLSSIILLGHLEQNVCTNTAFVGLGV